MYPLHLRSLSANTEPLHPSLSASGRRKRTPLLALLKGIGQLFPGPSKTTRAYTLKEDGIVKAAEACGFKLVRRSLNKAPFYFSRLIEFRKA